MHSGTKDRERKLFSRFKNKNLFKIHGKGLASWYQTVIMKQLAKLK